MGEDLKADVDMILRYIGKDPGDLRHKIANVAVKVMFLKKERIPGPFLAKYTELSEITIRVMLETRDEPEEYMVSLMTEEFAAGCIKMLLDLSATLHSSNAP